MSYPYFNKVGESLMDAASMRREQNIDSDPMTYYCGMPRQQLNRQQPQQLSKLLWLWCVH